MLSIHEDAQYIAEAIKAGVSCYISKFRMHTELIPMVTELMFRGTANRRKLEQDLDDLAEQL